VGTRSYSPRKILNEARQATRNTLVAATKTTPVATAKPGKKVTADDFTVQDFRGNLKTLSTQTQPIVKPTVPKRPSFQRLTPATPISYGPSTCSNSASRSQFNNTPVLGKPPGMGDCGQRS
jgi:hypothetical protein